MKRSEAIYYRCVIERSVQSLTDDAALSVVSLHPAWAAEQTMEQGVRYRHVCRLWRCLQTHTSQTGWEPGAAGTESLFAEISETHAGTLDDPIPYGGNMALENGKHYIQNAVIYLCTRDTVNPVYNELSELVGIYVEIV